MAAGPAAPGISCGRQPCASTRSTHARFDRLTLDRVRDRRGGGRRSTARGTRRPCQQPPVAPPAAGPAAPTRDPVTVRGCLEGRWLRILQHDSSDLSGVRRVRLKGSRSMLTVLKDQGGDYVEVTGDLDLGLTRSPRHAPQGQGRPTRRPSRSARAPSRSAGPTTSRRPKRRWSSIRSRRSANAARRTDAGPSPRAVATFALAAPALQSPAWRRTRTSRGCCRDGRTGTLAPCRR